MTTGCPAFAGHDTPVLPRPLRLHLRQIQRRVHQRGGALPIVGTGKWNRVLIDATMNLDYDPDPDFGGARFPPKAWPAQEDIDAVRKRWTELGLDEK